MPIIEFGQWLPDQPDLDNRVKGVVEAKNCVPARHGYEPFQSLEINTDALDAYCRGAIQAIDKNNDVYQYAGDATKLYSLSGGSWSDVSLMGGYSTATNELWEFARWKQQVLATNYTDDPQAITLGGANFANLTTALKGRHIAVVKDFVVLANTNDASDGQVPDRVRWSAIDDETDWTVSAATLSDFQDLKTTAVQQVFGGEYGVVFQTDAVWRMTFVGAPTVFQFDQTVPNIGMIGPKAGTQIGNTIYFLSQQGFYALSNGTDSVPIGAERVNQHVLNDLDLDFKHRISCAVDERGKRIFWIYPGSGNTSGVPNKGIIYDRVLNKWSRFEDELELLWPTGEVGLTLEELDNISSSLDALTPSLDSPLWQANLRSIGAFDDTHKSGLFTGDSLAAMITTQEIELHPGRRTRINSFRPIVEGGTTTAKVGTRNTQSDSVTFTRSLEARDTGRYTTRTNARYHRFQFDLSGNWDHAVGLQIERDDMKPEGRRG